MYTIIWPRRFAAQITMLILVFSLPLTCELRAFMILIGAKLAADKGVFELSTEWEED